MKAIITDHGLTLDQTWFNGCREVEVIKTGSGVVIRPASSTEHEEISPSQPDDPIWGLGRAPVLSDPLADGSLRHDEIIYQGR